MDAKALAQWYGIVMDRETEMPVLPANQRWRVELDWVGYYWLHLDEQVICTKKVWSFPFNWTRVKYSEWLLVGRHIIANSCGGRTLLNKEMVRKAAIYYMVLNSDKGKDKDDAARAEHESLIGTYPPRSAR